jgi:hypothetical protein
LLRCGDYITSTAAAAAVFCHRQNLGLEPCQHRAPVGLHQPTSPPLLLLLPLSSASAAWAAAAAAGKTLDLSPASIGLLSAFTHLHHLEISGGTCFDPATLVPLTALTHLQLRDVDRSSATTVSNLSNPQQQQQQLQGSAAVLAILPYLQELRDLELSPGLLPPPYCPVQQYSALTFSRHLTCLDLYHCQLTTGAAAAMFGGGRVLSELRCVRMTQPPEVRRNWGLAVVGIGADQPPSSAEGGVGSSSSSSDAGPPFGPGSFATLVSCCPALEQLWITAAVAPGVDLTPLQRFTGLTELQLGGEGVDDGVAENVLGTLGQLQRLDLVGSPGFTDVGLVHLTGLQQLTSLQVRCRTSTVAVLAAKEKDHPTVPLEHSGKGLSGSMWGWNIGCTLLTCSS